MSVPFPFVLFWVALVCSWYRTEIWLVHLQNAGGVAERLLQLRMEFIAVH